MCRTINVRPTSLFRSEAIDVHFFKLFDHCVGGSALRQLLWGIYNDDECLSETIKNTYDEHMFPFATEQFHIALRKNFQTDRHQTMVFHALSKQWCRHEATSYSARKSAGKSTLKNDSYRNHVTVEIRASAKPDYRLYYLLLKHMKILEFCEGFSSLSYRVHFGNLRKLSKADQP